MTTPSNHPVFALNYERLAHQDAMSLFASRMKDESSIDSPESFNRFCRKACRVWGECFPKVPTDTEPRFRNLLDRIEKGGEGTIATSWGGVVITLHEHPRVEKYLVIRQRCYLALEKHELKDERLEVQMGAGLLLWRSAAEGSLTVEAVAPSEQFHFKPGIEHCLIGITNLLVFEKSIDPKGMDRDLIFLYEPEPVQPS